MPDAPARLTDAALQPLAAQPELRQTCLKLLENMPQAAHPGAAAMIARWEAVDARKRRARWRGVLAVTLLVVSAWVLVGAVAGVWRNQRVLGWFGHFGTGRPAPAHELLGEGLSERDRFLLFGDLTIRPESERMRSLWQSAAENPAYFAEYAFAYAAENRALPPDFLATAQRLDPDNSWFTYHAAGTLAKDSVKRERQTSQAKQAGEAPAWEIVNEAAHKQALALLRDASRQTHFVNRRNEFIAARVALLPQSDQVSRMAAGVYLSGHAGAEVNMRYLAEAIAAQAWLLGEAGDAAGFESLLGEVDVFIKTLAGVKHPKLLDAQLLKANCLILTRSLQAAAQKLGRAEEAAQLKSITGRLAQWLKAQESARTTQAVDLRSSLGNASLLATRWQVKSPPQLAEDELKPGRMAEHLLAARLGSLAVWVLLGLGMVAVALFRFCLPQPVLRLAQRINELLTPGDGAWIIGAGVVLPFGYVTALMRLTPLGGQDWGLIHGGAAMVVAADFLALGLLMLMVPVLVVRWRLGRRAAALGICRGKPLLGWLAVAAGAALVPVIGMSHPPVDQLQFHLILKLSLIAMLLPLLLLLVSSLVQALAVTFSRQFSRAVVALALLPTYACGMLLLMASLPVYQAAQAGWERRDSLTELTAQGITRYEGEVARQLLRELREVLGLDVAR
jgi:hypothetical protein